MEGRGAAPPRYSDSNGYSDIDEMLEGTDPNDPCDSNPECAACLALRPPTPTPTPTVVPWFVILLAIVAAGIIVAVGYLVLRRKP